MQKSNVSTTIKYGPAPWFVFCDHASNFIPDVHGCLGIPEDILQTHIAWDPGAAALTKAIAAQVEGTALLSGFSRLLIDPNRSTDREDLVPDCADQVPIPGNRGLDYETRRARIEHYFTPYHQQLDAALSKVEEEAGAPFVLSVHSFTPRLMGETVERPWHIGLLWRHDPETAAALLEILRRDTEYTIGDNEPYDAREFNYSVDRHIAPRRLKHITLEIRQDLLVDTASIEEMARCLISAIRKMQAGETYAASVDNRD